MKAVHLLGLSQSSVVITFDIATEIWGESSYTFYPNIELDFDEVILPIKQYDYTVEKVGVGPKLGSKVMFATAGPSNKLAIYNYFLTKHKLDQDAYDSLIHPTAYISPSCEIEKGVLIEQNVIVSSQVKIGFGVFAKRGVLIGHHCVLGDFVDINPGVVLSGNIKVGNGVTIGTGAILRNNISIGENTTIGMGSVVTKDIPANSIAFGNPCKVVKTL